MKTLDAVNLVRQIIHAKLMGAQCAVDATAGNGHDTLYLAQTMPEKAKIWSFDIQEQAILNTKELLSRHKCCTKVNLIQDNHANLGKYIGNDRIDIALFNLGYLPGGDHQVTTNSVDMLKALQFIVDRLSINGMISLVAYPGHHSGHIENEELKSFFHNLSSGLYRVGVFTMLNQDNQPPVLYLLEKVRGEVREGIAPRQN